MPSVPCAEKWRRWVMSGDDRFAKELLKQNGGASEQASGKTQEEVGLMIAKEKVRLKRLKWIALIGWALALFSRAALLVTTAIVSADHGWDLRQMLAFALALPRGIEVMVFYVVLLTAVVATILLLIKSRSLAMRRIQARLADIEEQPRQLCQSG